MPDRKHPSDRREFLQAAAAMVGLGWPGIDALGAESSHASELRFGVVADCQYADVPAAGTRHYRKSVGKLQRCVAVLNDADLQFVVHVGDFIDRGFESFEPLLPIFKRCQAPTHHVLGNHDFSVAEEKKTQVPGQLGLPSRYYDFSVGPWRLVVLDGNDISLLSRAKGTDEYRQAEAILAKLKSGHAPHAVTWNGAVGDTQLKWLRETLAHAEAAHQRVFIFCHFPVYPPNVHNLWNDQELLEIFESSRSVVAYINGHNHAGNYAQANGIHYLTIEGMVETADTTAFAMVHAHANTLRIQGFGRVPDRTLRLR